VDELRRRGHSACVLTSTRGVGAPRDEGHVLRRLLSSEDCVLYTPYDPLLRFVARERRNLEAFGLACRRFRPELLYVWNAETISSLVLETARRRRLPIAHYVFDLCLTRWRADDWYRLWNAKSPNAAAQFVKTIARRCLEGVGGIATGPPDVRHAQFASQYLKDSLLRAGLDVRDAPIIPFGLDLGRYPYREARPSRTRLLFVGRLVPEKGLQTLVEALPLLRSAESPVTLTVAGRENATEYVAPLKARVSELGLGRQVRFLGALPREALTRLYHEHDILVFPSEWEEPFGITILEGMATGAAIVATGTGGSGEIARHGRNALCFPKADPAACARAIQGLIDSPELFNRLRAAARADVEREYDLRLSVDRIEASLRQAVSAAPSAGAARRSSR
jgi:glycosyltransferase involved in cell wall biosynthesis